MRIKYGSEAISLEIPLENFVRLIVPKEVKTKPDTLEELQRVMTNPQGPALDELVKSKSVLVMVEDHTRDEPHWELIHAVMPYLVDANFVQFIITTGSHVVDHPENQVIVGMIKQAAEDNGLKNYRIKINDCQNEDVVNLGTTSRGTPVIIDADAANHDVYVALADMKAHYFAGYSNALKDFLPGICAYETIEANHSMALDPNSTFGQHPYHPIPGRRNNPLADDMREAMEMITEDAKSFTLSVITNQGKLVWADAGELEPVISRGIEVLDEMTSFTVKPTSKIIVSPGGYPQDLSLYHAQRGLELTKNAVADGGEILFLAECRDGVAPPKAVENFYKKMLVPVGEIIESIKGKYNLYEHKAYKFAELLQRLSAIKMFTELDRETVESAHLIKVEDPQQVIDGWIAEDPNVKIIVLDKANKLAVYS